MLLRKVGAKGIAVVDVAAAVVVIMCVCVCVRASSCVCVWVYLCHYKTCNLASGGAPSASAWLLVIGLAFLLSALVV